MYLRTILSALLFFAASSAGAATLWDESIDGDLSSDGSMPTGISLQLGSNVIDGTVAAGVDDTRDFITFMIGDGQALVAINQLLWEDLPGGGPGNRGFNAISAGSTGEDPDFSNSDFFLGGDHVDAFAPGTNLLPLMGGDERESGIGFTGPLGAGAYTYVVQQTGGELNGYSLDFVVAALAVPEPSAIVLVLVASLLGLRRLR